MTPLVSKKQLKLLDWFEFERERLEQRAKDKSAKAVWSNMTEEEEEEKEEDEETLCEPVAETSATSADIVEEEEHEEALDDDDNEYFYEDDASNIHRLKVLLPAKYLRRYM